MPGKWTVIGISGVTCGGKTTLVKALKEKYPGAVTVCQDDYFLAEDDPRHTKIPSLNCLNWEIKSSLDMEKLRNDVKDILNRPVSIENNLLIIEGFLVLNDEFLSTICESKLYLTLSWDECKKRRSKRVYVPADVPGYFEAIVWPEYLKSKKEALELNPDIQCVDGLKDTDTILYDFLKSLE